MRYSTIFAASSALAGVALAEDIKVLVGLKNGSALFDPETITAAEGDNIIFKFWPKNHSVVQSTFADPCEPLEGGLWSGFVPTTDTEKASTTEFHYKVENASAPIWLYCSQATHCNRGGMVAVINPPSSGRNTLENFKAAALRKQENLSPSSTEPIGGNITNTSSTQPSGSSTSGAPGETGAASALQVNSFAVSGVLGMFAYFLL